MLRPMTLFAVLSLTACGDSTGNTGPAGPPGPTGPVGTVGSPGATGPVVALSERAKQGLDISPVAINLANLTNAQIEQIGQGSYLVNAASGCADCHDQQGATPKFLGGGLSFPLDTSGSIVYATNLTPDPTTGLKLTEAQFIDTMRTGKDYRKPTEGLVVMPWPTFRWMSTADLRAIYAYLKVIPAVSNAITADKKGPFAGAPFPFPTSYDEGDVPRPLPAESYPAGDPIPDPGYVRRGLAIQPLMQPTMLLSQSPEVQVAFARGSYLVNAVAGCNDCHTNPDRTYAPGANFLKINTAGYYSGGRVFSIPPPLNALTKQTRSMATNLSGTARGFTGSSNFSSFLAIIQTGTHADDPMPAPLAFPMPWQRYRNLTLDDLSAIYTYISMIPKRSGANDKATQEAAVYCAANSDCNTAAGETCNTATKECIGKSCVGDGDCAACQTCTATKCAAPAANSTCLTQGI